MMKFKITVFITMCIGFETINAQTGIYENLYRAGDTVEKRQIRIQDISRNGTDVLWNMKEAETIEDNYIAEFGSLNDTSTVVTCTERRHQLFYDIKRNKILIKGFEDRLTRISFDEAEIYLKTPIVFGDSIEGVYHGRGAYCDKFVLRTFGHYKTIADGIGTLILPSGDTLNDVTRLRTERSAGYLFYSTDSISRWEDLSPIETEKVDSFLKQTQIRANVEIMRWYARGYRYPVLETLTMENNGHRIGSTAFFCPPSIQNALDKDEANEKIRKRIPSQKAQRTKSLGNSQDFTYNARVARDNQSIILTYHIKKGNPIIGYSLYTIDGRTLYVESPLKSGTGFYRRVIDASDYPNGVYILEITVDGNHFTEKIIIRNKV